MGQWLDSRPIHLLSVLRCQSVIRFSDFVMTPLRARVRAQPHRLLERAACAREAARRDGGESSHRSQHLNGNRQSVSTTEHSNNQCTIGLTTCNSWPIHLLSVPRCQPVIRFSDFVMTPLQAPSVQGAGAWVLRGLAAPPKYPVQDVALPIHT